MNLIRVDHIETPGGNLEVSIDMPRGDGPFPAVIIVHGWRGNATKSERDAELSEDLVSKGVATMRLNLPGHGRSYGSLKLFTISQGADALVEAASWLSKQDIIKPGEISLAGTSIGGTCCIQAATQFPFKTLVLLSPRSDFTSVRDDMYKMSRDENAEVNTAILADGKHTRFYELATKITIPTLIMHGERDPDIACKQSVWLHDNIRAERKVLFAFPEGGHVLTGKDRTTAIEQTVNWLTTPG